jgi:hypothetical protein
MNMSAMSAAMSADVRSGSVDGDGGIVDGGIASHELDAPDELGGVMGIAGSSNTGNTGGASASAGTTQELALVALEIGPTEDECSAWPGAPQPSLLTATRSASSGDEVNPDMMRQARKQCEDGTSKALHGNLSEAADKTVSITNAPKIKGTTAEP